MDIEKIIVLGDVLLSKFIKSNIHLKVGINRFEFRVLLYIHSTGDSVTNRYLLRKCRNFRGVTNKQINVKMVIDKLLYCDYVIKDGFNIRLTSKGLLLCAKFSEFARDYFSSDGGYNYYYTEDNH